MSRQVDGIDRAASRYQRNLKIRSAGAPIEPEPEPTIWPIRRRGKIGGPRSINGHPGDRIRTPQGYVLVFCPDSPMARNGGYVLEHRLAMAQHIGRPLTDAEVVHHKDQIRHHNHIDNLRLFASNAAHIAHHNSIR